MKPVHLSLLLAVLPLSACTVSYEPGAATVTAQPSTAQPSTAQPEGQPVSTQAGAEGYTLRAYPNAATLKREEKGGKLKWEFGASEALERVYTHFHQQLTQQGWRRTEWAQQGAATKVKASYLKNGRGLDLKLDQKGKSGRYKLEVDTDD